MAGVNLTFDLFGKDHTASKALKGVGGEAEQTHGKLGKLGSMGKGVGLAVAGGVGLAATAMAAAAAAGLDMAKAAAEDERSASRLALALKNTTGATQDSIAKVEAWITKQGEAKGIADDALRPALGRLAQSTKNVGEAEDLASLAMDASAGTGKSLEAVSNALAKAHDGNVGALGRLGIATKDAEGKTLTFDEITANMAQTFKGQASDAAGTLEGKMGRLSLIFSETKETIGAAFLPALTNVGTWFLEKGVPLFRRMAEDIMPKLKAVWDGVAKAFEDNRPGLEKIGQVLAAVGGFVMTKVLPAFAKLQGVIWEQLIKVLGFLGDHLDDIGRFALRGAEAAIGGFRDLYAAVTGVLEGILTVADKTLGWLPGIGDKIKTAKAGFSDFRDHTTAKLNEVEAGIKAAGKTLDAWDEKAKQNHVAEIKGKIDDLKDKIATAKEKLNDPDLTKERRAEIRADIEKLKGEVKEANAQIDKVQTSKEVTVKIKAWVDADVRSKRHFGPSGGSDEDGDTSGSGHGLLAATAGHGTLGARFAQWGPAWSWNRTNGRGQHDGADISVGAGTPVYATRSGRVVFAGNRGNWAGNHVIWESGGTRFIYAHLSSIAGVWGSFGKGTMLGRVGSTGNSSGPHLHVQASRNGAYVNPAAYLAGGGIVRATPGGVPVVIGEGRYDEAVVPLKPGGGMGDVHIHINGGLDSAETIARRVQEALLDYKRRRGGVALGLA